MVGTFLSNCWAAVIAFTIYFLITFQSLNTPTSIIVKSFVVAIIVFFVTYLVRFIIAFVMYTPVENQDDANVQSESQSKSEDEDEDEDVENLKKEKASEKITVDQAEELAKSVKTMMANDE